MGKLQNLLINKIIQMKVDCEELQKDLTMVNDYVEIISQEKVFINVK